jgi:hypothetical protein
VSWRSWFGFGKARAPWPGVAGRPPSGNGASSFHLFWVMPAGHWAAVEATLEVLEPPTQPDLHFWALQAGFAGPEGSAGAGHLGLQWCPPRPFRAVNWGGYGAGGGILDGSPSTLPSRTGNPHTRDLDWSPATPYRLRIEHVGRAPDGRRHAFRGSVEDLATGQAVVVRELWAAGDRLERAMVWSEVFAPCDGPTTAVRWCDLAVIDPAGARHEVHDVTVNYQAVADGGCVTTDAAVDGTGVVQRTGTTRRTAQDARLRL